MPFVEPDNASGESRSDSDRLRKLAKVMAAVLFVGVATATEFKRLMGSDAEVKQEVRADVQLTQQPNIIVELGKLTETVKQLESRVQRQEGADAALISEVDKLHDKVESHSSDLRFNDYRMRTIESEVTLLKSKRQ